MIGVLNRCARIITGTDFNSSDRKARAEYQKNPSKADIYSVDLGRLTQSDALGILEHLAINKISGRTRNKFISALRGVSKEAFSIGLIDADQYNRMTVLEHYKGARLPAGRALSAEEVTEFIEHVECDERARGVRDAAIITMLLKTGLRRAELVDLDLSVYDRKERTIRVLGKGDNQRLVPLSPSATLALDNWVEVRGDYSGPLFFRIDRWDNLQPEKRLSTSGIYDIVVRRASQAGIEKISPHDMRRTCLTTLLDKGVNIDTVASIAGHASVDTTRIYDRGQEKRNKAAVDLLD
jgi:site-specific recombinase XerD